MKQTAIEQLIERLKELESLQSAKISAFGIRTAIAESEKMLPIEKQNIVDAAADQLLGVMTEEGAKQVGEKYFENTFKK